MEEKVTHTRPFRGADRKHNRWWALTGWGIPRSLDEVRFRDVAVVVIVALTIWGHVDVWPHGRIDPVRLDRHKTDFTVYTEAAAAFFDGRNPYHVTSPRGWYYLYPPLFALLIAPLTACDTEAQVFAWYVLSVALAFGCYFEARRVWRRMGEAARSNTSAREDRTVSGRWMGVCIGLAVALPTLDCLQRGQLGIALVYFLMLGFRVVLEVRSRPGWFLGGVILAFPAVVKLVPAFPVGVLAAGRWLAVLRPGRRECRPIAEALALTSGILVGLVLFLVIIPSALLGWRKNLDSLTTWAVQVAVNQVVGRRSNFDMQSPRNQSLANAVHLWTTRRTAATGIPPTDDEARHSRRFEYIAVKVLRGAVVVSLLALCVTIGRRRDPENQVASFGLSCWATLLISPLAWGHYYMIELPALLSVPPWLARRGWPATARVIAVIPALLSWAHYVRLRDLGPMGLLGLGSTAWFLAACGTIVGIEVATWIRTTVRPASSEVQLAGPHHLLAPIPATEPEGRSRRPYS